VEAQCRICVSQSGSGRYPKVPQAWGTSVFPIHQLPFHQCFTIVFIHPPPPKYDLSKQQRGYTEHKVRLKGNRRKLGFCKKEVSYKGKFSDFYSEGAGFEYRPGHRPSWLGSSSTASVPLRTLGWPYTEGTWLYCDYFIWCVSCTVVVLTSFVMCGCVYVWVCVCVGVCMYGFCNTDHLRGSFKMFPESLYFWHIKNSTIIQAIALTFLPINICTLRVCKSVHHPTFK